MARFEDRHTAGQALGAELARRPIEPAPVVLGVPRGGVPVAVEVARALGAPLDVLVVRKLGLPHHAEVAMGAVGEGDAIVWNDDVLDGYAVDRDARLAITARERAEVEARVGRFRAGRPAQSLHGKTAIVVDDGVATGATARVACRIARAQGAARVILAVPVATPEVFTTVPEADEIVALLVPPEFMAVGMHYVDFSQTSDDEVRQILADYPTL
ncbi:MAG TPA: phosphoribosyltransferase family protein [Candidatus Lumbricidophila sp.]|nr:phosphoribosyltransferase family protein [Candidatus Lumbricidophila sp.]